MAGPQLENDVAFEARYPWATSDARTFTPEEREEIELFQKQDRLKVAAETRRRAFEGQMRKARADFEMDEVKKGANIVYPFTFQLWHKGIQETRNRAIPAYTFDFFPKLPAEIRLRVWSLALFTEHHHNPRTYRLAPIRKGDWTCDGSILTGGRTRRIKGSSPVDLRVAGSIIRLSPKLLMVCRESRVFTRSIFSEMTVGYYHRPATSTAYFNTMRDRFYIGGRPWHKFKILIDLLIKLNTTRDLYPDVCREVGRLQRIRLLTVDLSIFAALPARLWTEFPCLEILTLAFYPFPIIKDWELQEAELQEVDEFVEKPQFITPDKRSKLGRRAQWIFESATESLRSVQSHLPQWKVPKLEVVVRASDEDEDFEIESNSDMSEDEGQDDNSSDDDSIYFEQLKARMLHAVPNELIKRIKRKHHRSRIVGTIYAKSVKKPVGTYFSDSERESGGPAFSAWKTDSEPDEFD